MSIFVASRASALGRPLKTMLLGSAAVAFALSITAGGWQQANAQSAPTHKSKGVSYNIPPQSLGSALTSFADAAGLKLLFLSSVVAGKTSQGLSGSFSHQQALSRLLAGTGLTYRFTAANTVTINDPSALGNAEAATVPGAIALDTIDVQGRANAASGSGYQGTPDWVYETPASIAVVSREAIQSSSARNTRDLLDNVAGVYANRSEAQNPGISVNIRGLQDQGRINTMIDGARQNFQRNGHGATQFTYVDTAFIRDIYVEKSGTSGVGGAGALGGLVNFRTIGADDLIQPGKQWGTELNATTGTNAFHFDGSVAVAAHMSDRLSFLGGLSHKRIGAYDVGENGDLNLGGTYDGNILLFSGQEVFSSILKAEAKPVDDVKLTLGWIRNESDFKTGAFSDLFEGLSKETDNVVNNTYTSALSWRPANALIDLNARLWYNHLTNNAQKELGAVGTLPIDFTMGTVGATVDNTSRFITPLGALSLNYGAEAFRDDGTSTLNGVYINPEFDQDFSSSLTGGTPSGKRDVASGFVNATLEHGKWLTVSGGLRYDWYQSTGSTVIGGNITQETEFKCLFFNADGSCAFGAWVPTGKKKIELIPVEVDQSDGALLPTLTVAVKPFDWLQPFVKYSKTFRPPTIMESFLSGGHEGSTINTFAPNPFLVPERGDTHELGANVSADRIFSDKDSFRFKVVGFYREIDDYITLGKIHNAEAGKDYTAYVNLLGPTVMKGFELEANYDARSFYVGGALTRIDTDFADAFRSPGGGETPLESGVGPPVLFVPPKLRVTLDAGIRLFEEKLKLGGRVTHVDESNPTFGSLVSSFRVDGYRIYDLYGSYAFDDTTTLRFNVNNLTDVAYAPALGASYYAAPGRTATVSLNIKY